jgi:hypothetical protein
MSDSVGVRGTLLTAIAAGGEMRTGIRVASVLLITALTAAAAQVSIPLPFTPVPFTLQPMVVLLGGAALGARLGMSAQVIYLLAGIAGLPVFAASAVLPQGPLRLLGPTGGFLWSYPVAALVAGATRGDRLRCGVAHGLLSVRAGGHFQGPDCRGDHAVLVATSRARRIFRLDVSFRAEGVLYFTYPRLLRRSIIS